jgi:isochorismate hydrolase
LAHPEKVPGFSRADARQQRDLMQNKWPNDIKREEEQKQILEQLLSEKLSK